MNGLPGEKLRRRYRILVAPLDWGLGHATRCIPVIHELLRRGCEVWLAGERMQEAVLKLEFPELAFLPLQGYRVNYPRTKATFAMKIIYQLPGIISAIRHEQAWLKRMIKEHEFDAVISDNRFGLYHAKVPTVFVTHQLHIKTSLGKTSEKILRRWNYGYINRFSECWVPDIDGVDNAAGELAHPKVKPKIRVRYLGLISRFQQRSTEPLGDHLLFILSGPEPQRTMLENKVVEDVSHYPGTATVVRGLPSSPSIIPSTGMIKFYNHLPTTALSDELQKAGWVISRSGYTTVMDILKLGKKSILIPTPGQTEQEYLATYLEQKQFALAADQKLFSLQASLEKASRFNYRMPGFTDANSMDTILTNFLNSL